MANEQTDPDAEALIARWGETVAREGWERIAATSSNPEYYDPWDAMEDTHPAKAHHRGMAHAAIRALLPAIEGGDGEGPSRRELADLLTAAVADIVAALILAGQEGKAPKWTAPYIEAINAYDRRGGTVIPDTKGGE